MEGSVITTQEIFSFRQKGIDEKGKIEGEFRFNGIRPRFIDKFDVAGIKVSPGLFDQRTIAAA